MIVVLVTVVNDNTVFLTVVVVVTRVVDCRVDLVVTVTVDELLTVEKKVSEVMLVPNSVSIE